jgi:hypothetical protein
MGAHDLRDKPQDSGVCPVFSAQVAGAAEDSNSFTASTAGGAIYLAMARGIGRNRHLSGDALEFFHELLLGLLVIRVLEDAVYRADLDALGSLEMTHALGTEIGVDNVNLVALADGAVRAFGLAHVAVDAFVSDVKRHDETPVASDKR